MKCQACGHSNQQEAKFCNKCGTEIVSQQQENGVKKFGKEVLNDTVERAKWEVSYSISSSVGSIIRDIIYKIFRR